MIIPSRSPADLYPLSFVQHRLWFIDQMEPGHRAYNNCRAVRFLGPLDVESLERALSEIVCRHEVLRTTYESVDGVPRQRIHPPAAFRLPVSDLSTLPDQNPAGEANRVIASEVSQAFDLRSDGPIRARLVRLGAEEHILALTVHHIAIDSMAPFFRELEAIYNARCLGLESPLPELPIQYVDYALWERDRLQGAYLDGLLAYWTKQLEGSSQAPSIPVDLKRPAILSSNGGRYYFKISSVPLEEFQALFRREGTTCYTSLLAAFSVLLMYYTGGEDVLLSSPAACRELPELEHLIGCFANTLVLRMDLSGAPSFRDLLKRAGRTVWAGLGHQRLPFHYMIGAAGPRRQATQAPPIQVNFRVAKADVLSLARLKTEFLPIHNHGAKFDLAAEFTPDLGGFLDYSTDLFRPESIPTIAAHFENLLGLLVRNPDSPITNPEFRAACARIKTPPTLRNFRRPAGVMAG